MTISITASSCSYTGDAVTVTFPVKDGSSGIYFETAAELTVTVDGVTQVIGTDYSVAGAGSATGSITFVTAPAAAAEISITRDTPLTQELNLTAAGPFSPASIMGALDKQVRMVQDIARDVAVLPTPEAGLFIGWDADGDALENKNAADFELTVGTVTTGAPGTDVEVTITGTATDAILNLTIPRGDQGASGAGSGDLVSTNNLSDVASAATSRSNLGLGSADNPTFANPIVTTLEVGHASDTTLSRSAAGVIAVEGTILKKVGKETIWIPAGAMVSRTTNGAETASTELATNDIMLASKNFDTTTEEGVGFMLAMPKSWDESTVTFKAFWTAASGSGGVAWGLAGYSLSDDDAMDTAVSGQQIVTDTLITANDMHITAESAAITIGGTPAEGDVVYFEITREVANGSDTLGVDAKLIGIHVYITSNAATDA